MQSALVRGQLGSALGRKRVLQITMHPFLRANLSKLYIFSGRISRGYPELHEALRDLRNKRPRGTKARARTREGV